MKAVMMSIKPKYVADILNGEKTIEVRKKFPKDYVGWVYIYVTKDENKKLYFSTFHGKYMVAKYVDHKHKILNGKVVARFWCDKVEEIKRKGCDIYTDTMYESALLDKSCLYLDEFCHYFKHDEWQEKEIVVGKAIHITKLEIFDKPKEIKEFRKPNTFSLEQLREFGLPYNEEMYKDMATKGKWFLTRAPESWCYIEV